MITIVKKPIPFAEFLVKSQHFDWFTGKKCSVKSCTKPACYAHGKDFFCGNHGVPMMQSLYVELLKRGSKAAIREEYVSTHTKQDFPDYVQQAIDEYSSTPHTGKPRIMGLLTYVPDDKKETYPSLRELAEMIYNAKDLPKVRYVTQGSTPAETAKILEQVIPTLEPGETLVVDYADFLIPPGKNMPTDEQCEAVKKVCEKFCKKGIDK